MKYSIGGNNALIWDHIEIIKIELEMSKYLK